ncbi:hypothetical protein BC937DRAFT_87652 [Endogone sp. FLAS-F59071]|nr:hypothetical protein BC937DRAFT_87652 [Endogone sp. FLAS-F59071]|eukprot:RUS19330.1 hypothetical protein BC937DRAFT_87652 [Endogone sp. FLAS-F59071]
MHEAVLIAHAQAMEEKDALLRQHEAALDSLQKSHDEVFRDLQKQQAQANAELRRRHNAELAELRTKLENAEKNGAPGATQQFNAEVEKLLAEIEAEEHNHAVQLDEFQRQQQQQLSTLQDSQNAQLKTLKQRQTSEKKRLSWRSQHAPIDAVSWPAPQPLSILRKTNGPQERKSTTKAAIEEDQLLSELKPKDNKKVQLYYSSVSGNATVGIGSGPGYQEAAGARPLTVAISQNCLRFGRHNCIERYPRLHARAERPEGFAAAFCWGRVPWGTLYQDIVNHVEGDDLETLLRPAARSQPNGTEDARHTDPNAPIRVLPAGPIQLSSLRPTAQGKAPRSVQIRQSRDEDAELLAELERELSAGKIGEDALQLL